MHYIIKGMFKEKIINALENLKRVYKMDRKT
jgi:hypothetical protein